VLRRGGPGRKRSVLERQLKDNERDLAAIATELEVAAGTHEQDYAQSVHRHGVVGQ